MPTGIRVLVLGMLIVPATVSMAAPLLEGSDAPGAPVAPDGWFYSRDLMPGFRDAQGHRLSVPVINDFTASGLDFVGHSAFGPGPITSFAVDTNGPYAYVGLGKAFVILNCAIPASPYLLGWVDLPATVKSIAYPGSGNLVHAVAGDSLYVIDATIPSSPVITGTLDLGTQTLQDINAPGGSFVYITAGTEGLRIVNVSTPATPTLTGTQALAFASGVFVSGTTAFVANGIAGVFVVNVSTPAAPVITTSFDTPGAAVDVVANGTHIYVSDTPPSTAGLRVLTNAVPPVLVTSILPGDGLHGLTISGTTLYASVEELGLFMYNITSPGSPVLLGSFNTPGFASAVDVAGSLAFVADTDPGIQIIDVSNPAAPTLTSTFAPVPATTDVSAEGSLQFLASGPTLSVIDLALPQRPRVLSKFTASSSILGLMVQGSRAYLAVGNNGLQIVNVANPAAPVSLSVLNTPGVVLDVVVSGTHAYVADGTPGLQIVDVSNPAAPSIVGTVDPGSTRSVAVDGTVAYLADASGLVVVDVSTPSSPAVLNITPLLQSAQSIGLSGSNAYVGTGTSGAVTGGVEILDVTTPQAPLWLAVFPFTSPGAAGVDVALDGTACYVATSGGTPDMGMRVLDVSNPSVPVEVGSFVSTASTPGVDVEAGFAHLTDFTNGAFLLHHSKPACQVFEPNETFATAIPITVGASYDAFVCTGTDVDYYAVTAPSGGTLGATMHPPGGLDYDLFLYNPSGFLVDSSMEAGSTSESVSATFTTAGTYRVLVRGHNATQFSSTLYYTLVPTFTACATIPNAVYLYPAPTLDVNGNVVLHVQDPNQATVVTGYNVYRDTQPVPPFPLRAGNVTDMDLGTPNVQFADVGSNVGGPYFYLVKATNGTCGSEGP